MVTWKHSGMVYRDPLDQKDFRPTHIYYKSTDLDYKTLSKDYKKRSKHHRLACSTLNKLYIDMETPMDGPKGPPGPERLQANTHLLQIH